MMKKRINIFVSFAVRNNSLVKDFIERFNEYILPSKNFEYRIWMSSQLHPGEEWDEKIQEQMERCDCAVMLVSPAFLISKYIVDKELPILINKPIVLPVMLHEVDLKRHDLHGLEKLQIYRLKSDSFKEPRAYYSLKAKRRDDFVKGLFVELEARLSEEL